MQLMPVALPSHRHLFAIRWFFKNRIEILHYLLILVIQYQGYFMGDVVNYGCNLLLMHLCRFINKKKLIKNVVPQIHYCFLYRFFMKLHLQFLGQHSKKQKTNNKNDNDKSFNGISSVLNEGKAHSPVQCCVLMLHQPHSSPYLSPFLF